MKYLISLFLLFSLSAQAALYTSSVTLNNQVPTIYYFNGPASSDNSDLFAAGGRYYGVAVHAVSYSDGQPIGRPPNYVSMIGYDNVISVARGDTWETLSQKYIARYGTGSRTGSWGLNSVYKYEACMAVSSCGACGTSTGVSIMPNSCSSVPWTNVTCNITDPALQISHGDLRDTDVRGHKASVTTRVTCSDDAVVTFRVNESRIYLGNGVSTDISINGMAMGSGGGSVRYGVPDWGLDVKIESQLITVNPQPGPLSGTLIVFVNLE